MTTFAYLPPIASTSTPVRTPFLPPATGPVGSPPLPPSPPPPANPSTAPRAPLTGISSTLVVDLTEASRLVGRAVEMLDTLPPSDYGSDATKDLRIRIYKTNLAAQSRLEKQFAAGNSDPVLSELRKADAFLEDANWQLAKKPSPDGRFTGVDIPGAIRDTREGARILDDLLRAAGGLPSTPTTPPVIEPPADGPHAPPVDAPSMPPAPPVDAPPMPPTPDAPPQVEPGSPEDGYPSDDEFPSDDEHARGGRDS